MKYNFHSAHRGLDNHYIVRNLWRAVVLGGIMAFSACAADRATATLCPAANASAVRPDALNCGGIPLPRNLVRRLILNRASLRSGDGLEQSLMELAWPPDFGAAAVPSRRAEYLFAVWLDGAEPRLAAFPVEPRYRDALLRRLRETAWKYFDAEPARQQLLHRIAAAKPAEHARKYLDHPFQIADFHLGAGTYEFTLLENPEGLDMICVEDQALLANRRWWLIPAHILPTDDARSLGYISWENREDKERKVAEIRFPLKKALPLE